MRTLNDCKYKKIGFPSDHPVDLIQVAHDLAVAKTTKEITDKDEVQDVYYRYYYNFEEFKDFFDKLKKEGHLEVPILKDIKP